ncbi:MAG: DUF1499 domain-containing protein [Balneolales bacterium]|nr:DUF1499 domain-containing protein [Balneolales bacterium]
MENPEAEPKSSAFSSWYFSTLFGLTALTALAFAFSGYGYNWGIWGLSTAFAVLRISGYMLIVFGIAGLLSLYFANRSRSRGLHLSYTLLTVLLSVTAVSIALYWQAQVNNNPFLHEVSTDTQNPPAFDAILPLRADAPNPPEFGGDAVAMLQRAAFPDLITIYLPHPKQRVYDEAVSLIGARGWDLVAGNYETGLIEATEKLPWFGFKDDVVIRLVSDNGRTVFDMRSKSRIGGTDLGVNAKRVQRFMADLKDNLAD